MDETRMNQTRRNGREDGTPPRALWVYLARSLPQNAYLMESSYMARLTPCMEGRADREELEARHMEALKHYNQAAQGELERYFQALNAASEGGRFSPDPHQLKMVAVDENCCLVIAGAGTGKSSTLAATVRNLLDRGTRSPDGPDLTEAKEELFRLARELGAHSETPPSFTPVKPEEILVLSYSNKAVQDLKDKFAGPPFGIPVAVRGGRGVTVSTFHSLGNAILTRAGRLTAGVNNGELRPDNGKKEDRQGLPREIIDFFKETYLKDAGWTDRLLLFFAQTFGSPGVPREGTLYDYLLKAAKQELESRVNRQESARRNRRRWRTIQGEMVRSFQEGVIADFLYENGVSYHYEPLYLDRQGNPVAIGRSRKYYTPDFLLTRPSDGERFYYEHFGVISDQSGPEETGVQRRYRAEAQEKISFAADQERELLYTYGQYQQGGSLLSHLRTMLLDHGFELADRTEEELLGQLAERRAEAAVKRFTDLLWDFISAYDNRGLSEDQYDRWLQPVETQGAVKNERTRLFLEICRECHRRYRAYLSDSAKIDFAKMISGAAALLTDCRKAGAAPEALGLRYQYIFVDEYQDISKGRSELLNALRTFCGARLMAIGDDWQSIYAFSGSDVRLFTGFLEEMGERGRGAAELDGLTLEITYRNPQSLIDLAGKFVMKNSRQIRKNLVSCHSGEVTDPVTVCLYEEGDPDIELGRLKETEQTEEETGGLEDLAREAAQERTRLHIRSALEHILERIWREGRAPGKRREILFLGRYQTDAAAYLEASELFNKNAVSPDGEGERWTRIDSPEFNEAFQCTFRTVHGAKGAQADFVILLNGQDDPRYGFPSKRENDPVLSLVLPREEDGEEDCPYAEERRLFYVALTRTKERVWCLAPLRHPSEFLVELKEISREMGERARVVLETLTEEDAALWEENDNAFALRDEVRKTYPPRCPLCGSPLQRIDQVMGWPKGPLRERLFWKRRGKCEPDESLSRLFICTGDQTQCGFMTNDPAGGTLSIRKCSCEHEADCRKSDRYYRVQHATKYFLAAPCEDARLSSAYASEELPGCLRAPETEEESVCMAEEDLVLRAAARLNYLLGYTYGESRFLRIFQQEDPSKQFGEYQQGAVEELRSVFPELADMERQGRLEPALTRTLEKGLLCSSLGLRLTHAGVTACRAMMVLRAVQQLEREVYPYGRKRFLQVFCKDSFEGITPDRAERLREAVERFPELEEMRALKEWSVGSLVDQMKERGLLRTSGDQYEVLKSAKHAPVWPPMALVQGDLVTHPEHGNGTVVSRFSENGYTYVTIDYETAGRQIFKY